MQSNTIWYSTLSTNVSSPRDHARLHDGKDIRSVHWFIASNLEHPLSSLTYERPLARHVEQPLAMLEMSWSIVAHGS